MSRLVNFSAVNPTGDRPGMEPVRLDVLKAAVNNAPPPPQAQVAIVPPPPPPAPPVTADPKPTVQAPVTHPTAVPLINKNIRLPADLVEFIDYVYTKDKRMKKQDAYTEALEAYFRPLMAASSS